MYPYVVDDSAGTPQVPRSEKPNENSPNFSASTDTPIRLAVVQYGDARSAGRLRESGHAETYYGMHYSQGFLDRWMSGRNHLVISLSGEEYAENHGNGRLLGMPNNRQWRCLPRTLNQHLWSQRIIRELVRFRPTHLLNRATHYVGVRILERAIRERWNTFAMFANMLPTDTWLHRWIAGRTVRALNHPCIAGAANHRRPACESMIAAGVRAEKLTAYDYVQTRLPENYGVKDRPETPPLLVFAGTVSWEKGAGDVVDAVEELQQNGFPVRLIVCGEGALRSALSARKLPDVHFMGTVSNEEVFQYMRQADAVVVPTRPIFPEGFPLSLTEALAARRPVIASDHPVFAGGLTDGVGVRFFKHGEPQSLAHVVRTMMADPVEYRRISESTATAWERLQCRDTFDQVITRWLPLPAVVSG